MWNPAKHAPLILICGPLRIASMLALFFLLTLVTAAQAQTFTVLHEFTGGVDGFMPLSG